MGVLNRVGGSRHSKKLFALVFALTLVATPLGPVAPQSAQSDSGSSGGYVEVDYLALLLGWEMQVIGHESGHALAAILTGGRVTAFRPYPHICGGMLVGGCVQAVGGSRLLMTMAGSMASNLIFLAATPHYFSLEEGFWKRSVQGMLFWEMTDFFIYTMIDAFKYGGDWMRFSEITGIPGYALIPIARLDTWALFQSYKYWQGNVEYGLTALEYRLSRSYQF